MFLLFVQRLLLPILKKVIKNKKMLTTKDYDCFTHNSKTFSEAITIDDVLIRPQRGIISSRDEVTNSLGRFIYTAPMDTVTDLNTFVNLIENTDYVCPVLGRTYLRDAYVSFLEGTLDLKYLEEGFVSIGLSEKDYYDVAHILENYYSKYNGTPNICIDVAHGWTDTSLKLIKKLKTIADSREREINIMAGSIATSEAALDLIKYGVTHLRVGIGPGKMCSTRLITGVGVPNLYAIFEIFNKVYSKELESKTHNSNFIFKRKVNIIADGGIIYPGDIGKYLIAGATGCMVGTAFANCIDSPAKLDEEGNKLHRGQASADFQKEHIGYIRNGVAEGVSKKIKVGEPLLEKANYFLNGLKSTVSYIGGSDFIHLNPINCKLNKVSNSTYYENKPME